MWQIGEVTVHQVIETSTPTPVRWLLPDAHLDELEAIEWLRPDYLLDEGMSMMTIQSLVIESQDTTIVVDTCVGNDKQRANPAWTGLDTPFLDELATAGFPPESIDVVLCTHLHVDHVGWNTRLVDGAWVPTFPRARYLFARTEWEHWRTEVDTDESQVLDDSVRPILDAGLAELVETDHQITSEVRLVPTPGHTPGHVAVAIESRGQKAVITGDLSHHPCQTARPHWSSRFDTSPEQAEATRRAFFADQAASGALVFGTHWHPTANRIRPDGDVWRAEPLQG